MAKKEVKSTSKEEAKKVVEEPVQETPKTRSKKQMGVYKVTTSNPDFKFFGSSQDLKTVLRELFLGANDNSYRAPQIIRDEMLRLKQDKVNSGRKAEELFNVEILGYASSTLELEELKTIHVTPYRKEVYKARMDSEAPTPSSTKAPAPKPGVSKSPTMSVIDWPSYARRYKEGTKIAVLCKELNVSSKDFYAGIKGL